ncbi:cardiolipin synthase ClsB [Solimonas sp. K1W22B-7]|uniref:cardiolipin synthase ClsB n=1 Tax=Solimonas sp. K1W22B-7 TaxID=2303331 RepID=UPI000E32E6C8|nr:cardiolipin synthase ClsB [Solimonas sp. K1W22B-7]AXQ31177.1 cardiolipin synthase ClsB [Solimonas sp. K1W22B-7]
MSGERWREGNSLRLLENGEEFFPRVFEAIRAARSEVLLETFILFDDPVGRDLRAALIEAASKGARVEVLMDHYGSPNLSDEFIGGMTAVGVKVHFFDAQPKFMGYFRVNPLRRLHRKLVVIDRAIGFIGGINYSHDHLREFGPLGKQDYSVEVAGPVVEDMRELMEEALQSPDRRSRRRWFRRRVPALKSFPSGTGKARALLVVRDNQEHRDDIERYYRSAIRNARSEVIIANAYFFPGVRLLREMRAAARRGVRLVLILQGSPDKAIMRWAAVTLYDYLLRSGVVIYEYCERPLHGKVAVIDDHWATVGSSNLDPLSLALNLEANLLIRDRDFTGYLRERLQQLMDHCCREVPPPSTPKPRWWSQASAYLVFRFLRRFPRWAEALPQHRPEVSRAEVSDAPVQETVMHRDAA